MPLRAVLKMIALFLSLAAFLVVGVGALMNGEELFWAVGKAIVTFMICWFIISWMAKFLSMSIEGFQDDPEPLDDDGDEEADGDDGGKKKEKKAKKEKPAKKEKNADAAE